MKTEGKARILSGPQVVKEGERTSVWLVGQLLDSLMISSDLGFSAGIYPIELSSAVKRVPEIGEEVMVKANPLTGTISVKWW